MSIKLDKEKQEILNKFDDVMRQNKEIQPETIKEIFAMMLKNYMEK